MLGQHPANEMLETAKRDDDAFRFAGAAAREKYIEWVVALNPARWRGHLENLLPKRSKVRPVEHFAALPYAEMSTFVVKLPPESVVP